MERYLKNVSQYLTQKTIKIKIFVVEIHSKAPKKLIPPTKPMFLILTTQNLETLDIKVYGPEDNRGYGDVLVVIDIFSEFG